jgi:hypothetical protein
MLCSFAEGQDAVAKQLACQAFAECLEFVVLEGENYVLCYIPIE